MNQIKKGYCIKMIMYHKKLVRFIAVFMASMTYVNADQYEFEQVLPTPQQNVAGTGINSPITINRQFTNINAVLVKLQSLGIVATVSKNNANEIVNQNIVVDGTVKDFINAAASKFGYSANIAQNKSTS